ncbi:MAG: hypothetical protein IH968_12195 [Gemmatimonadetes bacterium]|nr:hypothetical protein [Gemmatimonadota bacterium]
MRRTVAAPAILAFLLQGVVGGILACAQLGAGGSPVEGHADHFRGVLQASSGHSHTVMRVASDGDAMPQHVTGDQRDDSDHQDSCAMAGHCSASLNTHAIFTLAALPNRAPAPAFPGWVLHGAPQFGFTPPPKI